MSYPRNAASPPPFVVGQVVLIADGTVQTTGVSARVQIGTGAWTAASGTLAADATSGFWSYTPTQAETNAESFSVVIFKSSCIGDGRTVITSASNVSGYAGTDQSKITNATATVNLSNTTIKNVTDALTLTPAYDAAKTAATQTSVDTLATYVDTEVAAIKAKTDNLPTDPADASDIAASFATVNATLATIASYVDTEIAAIKAKTDNLPVDPADASDIAASFSSLTGLVNTLTGYVDTEVAAIKAKTDNLPVDPADASDISASFVTVNNTLATIAGYVDTEVAAIKAKTDLIPADIGSVLVSTNVNQREVAVTGSHHVASDIHEFQPGVITAADFAAGAIDANALAADAATEVANAVAATQALSRLDSMIESNGAGQFRFDTIALSMGAGGGGGAVNIVVEDRSITVE